MLEDLAVVVGIGKVSTLVVVYTVIIATSRAICSRSYTLIIIILVWVKKFSTHFDRWSKPDKNNTSYF